MKTKIITIAAVLLAASNTSAHAFWWWFWPKWGGGSGGGGGGGHSVPEIDALAGMASLAVIAGVVLLVREKFFRK